MDRGYVCLSSEWHSLCEILCILLDGNTTAFSRLFSSQILPTLPLFLYHLSIYKWQKTNLIFQDFVVVRLGFHEWLFMAFSVFTCDEIEWLSVKRAGGKFMVLVIKARVAAQHVYNVIRGKAKTFWLTFF